MKATAATGEIPIEARPPGPRSATTATCRTTTRPAALVPFVVKVGFPEIVGEVLLPTTQTMTPMAIPLPSARPTPRQTALDVLVVRANAGRLPTNPPQGLQPTTAVPAVLLTPLVPSLVAVTTVPSKVTRRKPVDEPSPLIARPAVATATRQVAQPRLPIAP